MTEARYDAIGRGYREVRRPDPRIAARLEAALGDAGAVLNAGAGTGSYEPADREGHGRRAIRGDDRPAELMPPVAELAEALGGASVEVVPLPHRCTDGFFLALWDRPEMHLDPEVRRSSSVWHAMDDAEIERGLDALRADLESGRTSTTATSAGTPPEPNLRARQKGRTGTGRIEVVRVRLPDRLNRVRPNQHDLEILATLILLLKPGIGVCRLIPIVKSPLVDKTLCIQIVDEKKVLKCHGLSVARPVESLTDDNRLRRPLDARAIAVLQWLSDACRHALNGLCPVVLSKRSQLDLDRMAIAADDDEGPGSRSSRRRSRKP